MSTVVTNPAATRLTDENRGVIELSPATAIVSGAVLLAIFTTVFWHFLYMQFRAGVEVPADWGHVLIVPFISGWFVWLRREELLRQPFRPAWTGLVIVVIGLLWYSIALFGPAAFQHGNIQGAGAVITLAGLCLLLCGWRAARWLWFPVLYWGVFGQTISQRALEVVTLRLQDWAAQSSYLFLNAIGFDTDISGNVLTIHGAAGDPHQINVAEACSGMRMVVAFLALGVAMAFVGLDRWWQRVVLVLMAVPVAIFVNILRVSTLGILSIYNPNMIQGEFHLFVGMLWLVPGFFMFLGIQWILRVLGEPTTTVTKKKGGTAVAH